MTVYKSFIGIDIGKSAFVVAIHGQTTTKEYDNSETGIAQFWSAHHAQLADAFCVLEATGGYELRVLLMLCEQGIAVHRANTRQVKEFIRSFGHKAKTDPLDAKALARYGHERNELLLLYRPRSKKARQLYELVQRRHDLKQMHVAEKNRSQSPTTDRTVSTSCDTMVEVIGQQIKAINQAIATLIANDPLLSQQQQVLLTIPGIGPIVASELLALMPELGQMNRREAALLAGVAPLAKDSGRLSRYRRVAPGRRQLKPILFLAAMAARNSKSRLNEFYEQLIARGKKKMVALVALMRKLIVIANAKLKASCVIPNESV